MASLWCNAPVAGQQWILSHVPKGKAHDPPHPPAFSPRQFSHDSGLPLLPNWAAAQQVTYYDFDGVTPSYTCTASSSGGSLFCFNNSDPTASLGNPALLPNSSYPANIDPNPLDNFSGG